jgi:hypothetical protein
LQDIEDQVEAAALDVPHREIRGVPNLPDIEDGHDVGMMQAGCRPDFTEEAFEASRTSRCVCRQYFQRHPLLEQYVNGLIDNANVASANLSFNAVIAEE